MPRSVSLLGVPSSAGASWPGLEKGPAAWRASGIVEALAARGVTVDDRGDLPVERWQVDLTVDGERQVNNVARTVEVAGRVQAAVAGLLAEGRFPLVLGGDCTITVGAYAGAREAGITPLLVYVDEGADTATPATTDEAHLDGMGVAHMLALPHTTALRDIGPVTPLLVPGDLVYVGLVDGESDHGVKRIGPSGPRGVIPAGRLRGRGREGAREALAHLQDDARPFWLHWDVDVIDFFDLPVADVPVFRGATPFVDVAAAIAVLAGDPRCLGITVTEFNPDHASPDGSDARALVEALASAVAG